jgi:hypothetical protein
MASGHVNRTNSAKHMAAPTSAARVKKAVLGGLAEFERDLIKVRTTEGRRRAVDAGVKLGRRPRLPAALVPGQADCTRHSRIRMHPPVTGLSPQTTVRPCRPAQSARRIFAAIPQGHHRLVDSLLDLSLGDGFAGLGAFDDFDRGFAVLSRAFAAGQVNRHSSPEGG